MKRCSAYGVALVVMALSAAALAIQQWEARTRHVLFHRYFWERGRCYGIQVVSGAVTQSKVPTPDGYCPRVDWSHPPPDMTWKAVVDCSFDECPSGSLFENSLNHLVSKLGGGPTKEEACQNAEYYLKASLQRERCIVKDCRCFQVEHVATR